MSLQQQQKQADDYKEEFELIFEDEKAKEIQSIIFTAFSRIPWREFISNISKKQRCEKETIKSFACKKKGGARILIKPNQTFYDLITRLNYSIIIIQKYFSINDKKNCNVMNKWLFCPSIEVRWGEAITIKNNTLLLAAVEGEQGSHSISTGFGYKLFDPSNNEWSPSWINLHGESARDYFWKTHGRYFYWSESTSDYLYVVSVFTDKFPFAGYATLADPEVDCKIMVERFVITDDITNNLFKDTRNYSIHDEKLKIMNSHRPKYHYIENDLRRFCRISSEYLKDAYHIEFCQINDEIIHMVIFYYNGESHPTINRHFIWNRETNEVTLKHIFHAVGQYPAFIHLRKNKCLMLIGIKGIVIYCLIKKVWYKLLTKKKLLSEAVVCLITEKEDKVIIAGGYDSNKIWIYNVSTQTLKESCVLLPAEGKCTIFTNNSFKDELLTFGWIRTLYKQEKFDQITFPPNYLIKMMFSWYHLKMLYWITEDQHQAIEMSYIMNNVKQ